MNLRFCLEREGVNINWLNSNFFAIAFFVTILVPQNAKGENLALGKTVTVDTAIVSGQAANAVDGDYITSLYSYQGSTSQIVFTIDLQSVEGIAAYRLQPMQSQAYQIESSVDGAAWTLRYTETDWQGWPDNRVREIAVAEPYQARYLRYTGNNSESAWVGVMDFEVFDNLGALVFAGGYGTASNPYQVTTPEELNTVRDYLDDHFILMNDIDLGIVPYNVGVGWEPIGIYVGSSDPNNAPFTGRLDGDGYSITNLYINRPDMDYVGLFGDSTGASFVDLTLQVEVTGRSKVAGLVGNLEPGSISNVHVSGTVTGNANEVAGLAGRVRSTDIQDSTTHVTVLGGSTTYGGGSDLGGLVGNVQNSSTITNCSARGSVTAIAGSPLRTGGLLGTLWESSLESSFATGTVIGRDSAGGLIGHNGKSTISKAFATGDVSSTSNGITNFGGLVGTSDSGSTISDTFATGNVNGIDKVGGLIGRQTVDSSVSNSYAMGQVSGTTSDIGGLLGINYGGGVNASYYDTNTSGQSDTTKGEPKTTAEMKNENTFLSGGWDFSGTWEIDSTSNNGYPILSGIYPATDLGSYSVGGIISGLNPGSSVILQNNQEDDLTVLVDGWFSFSNKLQNDSSYSVTVHTHPVNPKQICNVTNGSGTVSGGDVGDVTVTCEDYTFPWTMFLPTIVTKK